MVGVEEAVGSTSTVGGGALTESAVADALLVDREVALCREPSSTE